MSGATPCGFEQVTTWLPNLPFHAMAAGGGRFVAVGSEGLIATSVDAAQWQVLEPVTASSLTAVTHAAGAFVAVGDGVVVSSADGATWVVAWAANGVALTDVAWLGGRFVAVGESAGQVLTSVDGVAWSLAASGVAEAFTQVEAGGSLLLALGGGSGALYASVDGVAWQQRSAGFGAQASDLGWDGTQFMLVGDSDCAVRTSADGWTWATRYQLPGICSSARVAGGDGVLVAAALEAEMWNWWLAAYRSTDSGATWQAVDPTELGVIEAVADLLWDGSRMVALTVSGDVLASADGQAWECTTGLCTTGGLADVSLAVTEPGLVALGFVVVSSLPKSVVDGGLVAHSADGISWEARASPYEMASVTWAGGRYVAAGYYSAYTSVDGWVWSGHEVSGGWIVHIAHGAGLFVGAGGLHGFIATSPDGETWTPRNSGADGRFSGLLWDGSRFLAAAPGVVSTSSDGLAWTTSPSGISSGLTELLVADGGYLALASSPSRIVTSDDGLSWSDLLVPPGLNLYGLARHGDLIVAVGHPASGLAGDLVASQDRAHWTTFAMGPWRTWPQDIVWYHDAFVVVGKDRAVRRATCLGTLAALDPPAQQVEAERTGVLTLSLSAPVSEDTWVELSAEPAATLYVASPVVIAAGQTATAITVRGLVPGIATVTATLPDDLGGGWTSASVEVLPAPAQGAEIPALSTWGAAALALLVALMGAALITGRGRS